MTRYVLRRLASTLLLLYLVLTLTFFLLHLAPGDPTQLFENQRVPETVRAQLRHVYGLDRPLLEQYGIWLESVVLRGDWGVSFRFQESPVAILARAFPNTLVLSLAALLVGYTLALPLGMAAARRRGTAVDHGIRFGSMLVYSLPIFWTGLMAILLFSYAWPVLPAGGTQSVGADALSSAGRLLDRLRHLVLPALILGSGMAAAMTRFVRNDLLDVLHQDYLTTARSLGVSEGRVLWVHALRNALVPLVQIFGLILPMLLSGALIVEVIFAWPGIGRVTYNALLARDYPLILAAIALSATLVVLGNLLADLLHAAVDPRVRHG